MTYSVNTHIPADNLTARRESSLDAHSVNNHVPADNLMARRKSSLVGMMNLKFVLKIAVQKPIRPRCRIRVHHWAALVRPLQQSYSGEQFDDTTREQFGHSVNNHNIPTDNLMARRASSLVGMMNLKFVVLLLCRSRGSVSTTGRR